MPTASEEPIPWPLTVSGLALIAIGNVWQHCAHRVLAELRAADGVGGSKYSIPHGCGFDHVSCPHYTAEVLIYIGFVVLTGFRNRCVVLMAAWVACNLSVTAWRTRAWYRQKFAGRYPTTVKAIVPGLL